MMRIFKIFPVSLRVPVQQIVAVAVAGILFGFTTAAAQSLAKTVDDDVTKFTTAGNISATITNFGVIGNNFNPPAGVASQASCQYPKGSGIEHLKFGALWIGAIRSGMERPTFRLERRISIILT
jgi:hypothetical protein